MDRICLLFIGSLFVGLLGGCVDARRHREPYQDYVQVGLLGHGQGLLGDLKLNYYGVERGCDSCHTTAPKAHSDLGTCNRCHQPHASKGWDTSLVSLNHTQAMTLEGRKYHFILQCKDCHQSLQSPIDFQKEVGCIHCHNHTPSDIKYAHELMSNFDMEHDNRNSRCVDCHVKTGKDYARFYNPTTDELR